VADTRIDVVLTERSTVAARADCAHEECSGSRRAMVTPFARTLALLEAWTPADRWLGNFELSLRTGLHPSTVTRLTQSLVQFGYLHHDPGLRKYRLAAAVLALGYGAIASSDVQGAPVHMQAYADRHKVHVNLSARDRLQLIVLESCTTAQAPLARTLGLGARVGLASPPMGWALLAALPEVERSYLLEHVQRRMPGEWSWLRRRASEGIAQVQQAGWCTSPAEPEQNVGIIAAPLLIPDHVPLVLACIGSRAKWGRARVERELAPRLLAMARAIQRECTPTAP